jgi:hypothetical protein
MEGVLTTALTCWDSIGVAMSGVTLDLDRMSLVRQDTNVREQSHEDKREHDGSQFSSPQHHRGEYPAATLAVKLR